CAEIVRFTAVLDFRRGFLGINAHTANRIAFHLFSYPYFINSLGHCFTLSLAQMRVNQFQQLVIHRLSFWFFFCCAQSFSSRVVCVHVCRSRVLHPYHTAITLECRLTHTHRVIHRVHFRDHYPAGTHPSHHF